jgi:uncharacterized protein YkwD
MKKIIFCILSSFLILGCSEPKVEKRAELNQRAEDNNSSINLLLKLHNKERESKNIEKLTLDKNLCDYAQKHAENMVIKNSLYHSKMRDLMKESKGSIVGENIAWGQKTEQEVVNSWMWSPMHRRNILSKSYTRVGFGIAKTKDGSIYWCVVFSNKEV